MLCVHGASITELHLNFTSNHSQNLYEGGGCVVLCALETPSVNSLTPLSTTTINFCYTFSSFKTMKCEYVQNVSK